MNETDTALLISERFGLKQTLRLFIREKNDLVTSNIEDFSLDSSLSCQIETLSRYFSQFDEKRIYTEGQGTCLAVSSDKRCIFYGTSEGRVFGLAVQMRETIFDLDLKKRKIIKIALTSDNLSLIIALKSGQIIEYDIQKKLLKDENSGHENGVTCIVTSGRNNFVTCGNDGKVKIWEKVEECLKSRDLFQCSEQVLALDFDFNGKNVVSGGFDGVVKIFCVYEEIVLKEIKEDEAFPIYAIKLTENLSYLAFGDKVGNVHLYTFRSWGKIWSQKGHKGKILSIQATDNESCLVSTGRDGKMIFWNTEECDRTPLIVDGGSGTIYQLAKLPGSDVLYSISADKIIRNWCFPKFNHYKIIYPDIKISDFSNIMKEDTQEENFFMYNDEVVVKLNKSGSNTKQLRTSSLLNKVYAFDQTKNLLCIASCNKIIDLRKSIYSFDLFNTGDFSQSIQHTKKCHGVHSMIFSTNSKFLIIGECFRCSVVELSTFTGYLNIIVSKNPVILLSQSPSMKFLVLSGENTENVKMYNFFKKDLNHIYEDPGFLYAKKIVFTQDEEFFVFLPTQGQVTVWTTCKPLKVNSMENDGIQDIEFNKKSENLYILKRNTLEIFHFPSLVINFCIVLDEGCKSFAFSNDYSDLVFLMESKIEVWMNPGKFSNQRRAIATIGNNERIYEFCEYISKIISSQKLSHEASFDTWIIEPFHISPIHLYCHFNRLNLITSALEGSFSFPISYSGFSPLDICLENNALKGISLLYKFFENSSFTNPFISSLLKLSVNKLVFHSSIKAKDFLELIFLKSMDHCPPAYSERKLPKIIFSSHFFNMEKNKKKFFIHEGSTIEYLQTYFKLNLKTGSKESIEFFKSLHFTRNEETFNSKFVRTVLQFKWNRVKKVLIYQGVLYYIYLVLLSLYCVNDEFWMVLSAFTLNILLILYELMQFSASKLDYLIDPWNYIDISRSILMTYMFTRHFEDSELKNNIIATVIIVSWARGIAYFRVIKATRYYIRLISQMLSDIIPFLFLFFYSTLAFSFMFYRLDSMKEKYAMYLGHSWEINIGAYSPDNYSKYLYTSYTVYTLFNPILMLTLLVSILGESYETVSERVVVAEACELCKMILEAELILFWRRNVKHQYYFHVTRNLTHLEVDKGIGQIFKKKLASFQNQIEEKIHLVDENCLNIGNKIDCYQNGLELVNQRIDGFEEKMLSIERKIEEGNKVFEERVSELKEILMRSRE